MWGEPEQAAGGVSNCWTGIWNGTVIRHVLTSNLCSTLAIFILMESVIGLKLFLKLVKSLSKHRCQYNDIFETSIFWHRYHPSLIIRVNVEHCRAGLKPERAAGNQFYTHTHTHTHTHTEFPSVVSLTPRCDPFSWYLTILTPQPSCMTYASSSRMETVSWRCSCDFVLNP